MYDITNTGYMTDKIFGSWKRTPEPVYFHMSAEQRQAVIRGEKWLLTDEQREAIKAFLRPEIRAEIIAELQKA